MTIVDAAALIGSVSSFAAPAVGTGTVLAPAVVGAGTVLAPAAIGGSGMTIGAALGTAGKALSIGSTLKGVVDTHEGKRQQANAANDINQQRKKDEKKAREKALAAERGTEKGGYSSTLGSGSQSLGG